MSRKKAFLFRLASYAPRHGRSAREDFLTEVLAATLEADRDALVGILDHAKKKRRISGSLHLDGTIEVSTQYTVPEGRPDIVVLVNGKPALFIESKLQAGFTFRESDQPEFDPEEQIPRYVKAARRHDAKVALISIVPRHFECADPIYVGNFLWSDVHEFMKTAPAPEDPRSRVLRAELVCLLESFDLMNHEPLRSTDGERYYTYRKSLARMQKIVDTAVEVLSQCYVLPKIPTKPGGWYGWQDFKTDKLHFGLGIVFSDPDEDPGVWPCMLIQQSGSGIGAMELIQADEAIGGWPGKGVYSDTETFHRFQNAESWEEQVKIGTAIWDAWLATLANSGLVARVFKISKPVDTSFSTPTSLQDKKRER